MPMIVLRLDSDFSRGYSLFHSRYSRDHFMFYLDPSFVCGGSMTPESRATLFPRMSI